MAAEVASWVVAAGQEFSVDLEPQCAAFSEHGELPCLPGGVVARVREGGGEGGGGKEERKRLVGKVMSLRTSILFLPPYSGLQALGPLQKQVSRRVGVSTCAIACRVSPSCCLPSARP
jgi:hypothetical protein